MIPVIKGSLKDYYEITPVNYESYLKWLDDDKSDFYDFEFVSTFNYEINQRHEWNIKGREVYSTDDLKDHVAKINLILDSIHAESFVVQHEYIPGIWLPSEIVENAIKNRVAFEKIFAIRLFMKDVDLSSFDGGFVFDNTTAFLKNFIDYPYLLSYRNLDLISLNMDLILKINHHMEVLFISSNKQLLNRIRTFSHQQNLRFWTYPEKMDT